MSQSTAAYKVKEDERNGSLPGHLDYRYIVIPLRSLRLRLCAYIQEGRTWKLGMPFGPSCDVVAVAHGFGLHRVADHREIEAPLHPLLAPTTSPDAPGLILMAGA